MYRIVRVVETSDYPNPSHVRPPPSPAVSLVVTLQHRRNTPPSTRSTPCHAHLVVAMSPEKRRSNRSCCCRNCYSLVVHRREREPTTTLSDRLLLQSDCHLCADDVKTDTTGKREEIDERFTRKSPTTTCRKSGARRSC